MSSSAPPAAPESTALARDRLGIPAVLYFILSAMAPMTVAAGVVTTLYAVTGLSAIGAAFVAVALVLAVFAVGYVAMARHITNAGALYAYISRGLGRPAGVGAALVAALAYNLLQVGLYGMFGPTLAGYWPTRSAWTSRGGCTRSGRGCWWPSWACSGST
jgi:amino acid transporter